MWQQRPCHDDESTDPAAPVNWLSYRLRTPGTYMHGQTGAYGLYKTSFILDGAHCSFVMQREETGALHEVNLEVTQGSWRKMKAILDRLQDSPVPWKICLQNFHAKFS